METMGSTGVNAHVDGLVKTVMWVSYHNQGNCMDWGWEGVWGGGSDMDNHSSNMGRVGWLGVERWWESVCMESM